MISKGTNNKQQNQTAIPCDAGSVVMGRTADNGEYKILKTDNDGGLIVTNSNPFLYLKGTISMLNNTFPVGLKLSDTLLAKLNFSLFNTIDLGLLNFVPNLTIQSLTQPIVNLFIIPLGTNLGIYTDSLPIGNIFAPDISFLTDSSIHYFKHQIPMQKISNTLNNYCLPITSVQDKFAVGVSNYLIIATLHNSVNIINANTQIQISV